MKEKELKMKSSKRSLWQKMQTLEGQKWTLIILFSLIPLAMLLLFTYIPFAQMVEFSFYDMKYSTPMDKRKFVGWKNYIDIFKRDDTLQGLLRSGYYMVGAIVQIVLAMYLAVVLTGKMRAKNLFKGIMFFPYMINAIAIGFIFKFFFTRTFVFDTVLQWFGFSQESLPYWLRDKAVNNWSLAFSSVWRYFGQNMVLFGGAIMSIDTTLFEAAEIDGANKWQQFVNITLPSIRTIITLNVIMAITGSLSAFEQPFVVTGGANGTATYFIVMHNLAHVSQKIGLASAMSIVLFIVIIIFTIGQRAIFKYFFREADSEVESYKAKKARKKSKKTKKA